MPKMLSEFQDALKISGYIEDYRYFNDELAVSKDGVHVCVNSQGGNVYTAVRVHNELVKKNAEVLVDPFAFSAAAIIVLGGKKRYMVSNGLMMLHSVRASMPEGIFSTEELEAYIKLIDSLNNIVEDIINKCSKVKLDLSQDNYFTADEALKAGLIDEVIPAVRAVNVRDVRNQLPVRFVAYLENNMPLKDVCDKFGIEASEEALIKYVNELKPKPPTPVNDNILKLIKTSREQLLNSLVEKGKVTPNVVNELKLKFLTDDRIKLDAINDNSDFDSVIAALDKNDSVLTFGSKTGVQLQNKTEANPLLENMKKRSAK